MLGQVRVTIIVRCGRQRLADPLSEGPPPSLYAKVVVVFMVAMVFMVVMVVMSMPQS